MQRLPRRDGMMKNIHISKLTAALACFALGVALLWLHGTMEASLLAARALVCASDSEGRSILLSSGKYGYTALMDTAGVEMNATLALIGAGVLFCIGLVLCIAAAFKRKAKPDNDSAS
jgi:hypothetical protein